MWWQIQNPESEGRILVWAIVLGAFILVLGLIPVLHALPPRGRRAIIVVVTFFAGLFFATEFFTPVGPDGKNFLTDYIQPAQQMIQVISALALGLGTYGLIRLHLRNVVQRRPQWGYSVVLLLSFLVMAGFSIANTLSEQQLVEKTDFLERGFALLFDFTLVQLDAAMFSLIAFYIFSAAYRAFRIRSVEAGILMFTAMIVMIGIVPLGAYLSYQVLGLSPAPTPKDADWITVLVHNLALPKIADWVLIYLNAPVQRAIEFGVGIGGLAMAIRL
ncbi:MAG: hypothetical protein C4336_06955, partial [Armatimonadota bacterium]